MANATFFSCHQLFTFWMVVLVILILDTFVVAGSLMAVSRMSDGDKFTKPYSSGNPRLGCAKFQARCSEDLLNECNECKCNLGNETYRHDVKRCVSSENLDNYTGCSYKGLASPGIMDMKLMSLDLTKKGTKKINAPLRMAGAIDIKCGIGNKSSFLNQNGRWMVMRNISQVLRVDISQDHNVDVSRYLILNWEGVNRDYCGLLVKLHIECKSATGVHSESDCFLFKAKGRHIDEIHVSSSRPTTSTRATAKLSTQNSAPTAAHSESNGYTTSSTTTQRVIPARKNISYSALRTVIIGVSAGVGFVILTIVILAICCVRYRTRKAQETKQVASARMNDVPKVHFTAQTRFSLIKETDQAQAAEPSPDDYTCLQDRRESYDPYFSLRKDDVDLDVIDQILKEAVSMESMKTSSEPRYSCRLSGDRTTITAAEPPHTPEISREYHVLEEPDYEEVDSSSDEESAFTVATKILEVKPALPERQYHTLEPPETTTMYSEC